MEQQPFPGVLVVGESVVGAGGLVGTGGLVGGPVGAGRLVGGGGLYVGGSLVHMSLKHLYVPGYVS